MKFRDRRALDFIRIILSSSSSPDFNTKNVRNCDKYVIIWCHGGDHSKWSIVLSPCPQIWANRNITKKIMECHRSTVSSFKTHAPYSPCMVYLPLCTYIWWIFEVPVGKKNDTWSLWVWKKIHTHGKVFRGTESETAGPTEPGATPDESGFNKVKAPEDLPRSKKSPLEIDVLHHW